MIRRLISISITALAMIITSCAAPMPTSTLTSTATPLPSATSAPTLTPTATVDPNMPPSATGKDAEGNYTKIENGIKVTWNTELKAWQRRLNLNGKDIPLIVWGQKVHDFGSHDFIFLTTRVSDKVQGFDKIDSISLHLGANMEENHYLNFSNQLWSDLTVKVYGSLLNHGINGTESILFTTSEGPQSWKLGPNTQVIVDILDAPMGAGFFKGAINGVYDGIDGPGQTKYQIRVFTDPQGNLHEWIVPGKPVDKLTKQQIIQMYLFAPAYLTRSWDFTEFANVNLMELQNYVQLLTKPAYPPFIDFSPPQ